MLIKAVPADKNSIRNLYEAVKSVAAARGNSTWNRFYPTSDIIDSDLSEQSVYLYYESGRLIGSVSLRHEDEELAALNLPWAGKRPCYLARLCIHPDFQNLHRGELLMREAAETAKGLGYDSLRFDCNFANPAAYRLYTRMGYVPLGTAFVDRADHYIFERCFGSKE